MRFYDRAIELELNKPIQNKQPEESPPCTRALSFAGARPRWGAGKAEPLAQAELGAAARFALSQTPAISAKGKTWKFPPGLFSSLRWICGSPFAARQKGG